MMNRRKALLNMGKGLGFTLTISAFSSLLSGCKTDADHQINNWTPRFFTPEEGSLLIAIVDTILPATDTLAASQVNVHTFIDGYAAEVMNDKEKNKLRDTVNEIGRRAALVAGETSPEVLTPVIMEALTAKGRAKIDYAKRLRSLTIWAYRCNEYVGTEVLAYDPVPGKYIPCGDLQELTGGRSWSI